MVFSFASHNTLDTVTGPKCFWSLKEGTSIQQTLRVIGLKTNPGRIISRYDFCRIFLNAYNEKMNMINIFGGFRATGIYPLNPLAIPAQACGPSNTSVLAPVTSIASEG